MGKITPRANVNTTLVSREKWFNWVMRDVKSCHPELIDLGKFNSLSGHFVFYKSKEYTQINLCEENSRIDCESRMPSDWEQLSTHGTNRPLWGHDKEAEGNLPK